MTTKHRPVKAPATVYGADVAGVLRAAAKAAAKRAANHLDLSQPSGTFRESPGKATS